MKMLKLQGCCVRSVPGTGTRFLQNLLLQHGINLIALHYWEFVPEDLHKAYTGLKICPIRDPAATYRTWYSNDRDLGYFKSSWEMFNEAYENSTNMCIVPVDTDEKELALTALSKRIGISLKTDWTPVGSVPRKEVKVPDLFEVYQLPVVQRYYGRRLYG